MTAVAQMMQTRQDILEWVEGEYGTEPEHLWAMYPDYVVLRNRGGKWYGILMNLPGRRLGIIVEYTRTKD